jgi:hypothetical protein
MDLITTPTTEYRTARLITMVEPSLAERLAAQAMANDRSLSSELRHLLRQAVTLESIGGK